MKYVLLPSWVDMGIVLICSLQVGCYWSKLTNGLDGIVVDVGHSNVSILFLVFQGNEVCTKMWTAVISCVPKYLLLWENRSFFACDVK